MSWTRSLVPAVPLCLALVLTGCGGNEPEPAETSATEHNAADVEFAGGLLQQHAETMTLVDLTVEQPVDGELADVVEDIRTSHAMRTEELVDLLTEWDEEIPETVRDHSNAGHDHDPSEHTDLPEGPEFPAALRDELAAQHEAALELVATETSEGRYAAAVELAEAAETELRAELERLEGIELP